ncbi:MAG: 3-oxoacyl-ACP synthase III [Thermodesulfobacteriota bacterium]
MHYTHACLHSFGYALPPHRLSSEEIELRLAPLYERLKLPVGRLELMSGISERRFWDRGTRPSQGASLAGQDALKRGDIDPATIQCLIFTSVSRDMMEPATASFVHNSLGLAPDCLIFDISNACLGFLDGMVMLANMIELGQVENGLVVAGETAEELVESTISSMLADTTLTRKSIKPAFASLTIGSGAVALYMTRAEESEQRPMLRHGAWLANTAHSNLCQGDHCGSETTLMETNSEELLVQGVETANRAWQRFTAKSGWQDDDIDCFCCHQVGTAHAKLLFETLGLNHEKNFQTLSVLGNVGSVSAPITLAMAMDQGAFAPGMKAALLGIGSGINCLMLGVKWPKG